MQATDLTPTTTDERYQYLDVLRGAALFGIVSANMILYSLYLQLPDSARAAMSTHTADQVLDFLELMLIEGKFYTIFSVLFGLGFSILLVRSHVKGIVFHNFFLRPRATEALRRIGDRKGYLAIRRLERREALFKSRKQVMRFDKNKKKRAAAASA